MRKTSYLFLIWLLFCELMLAAFQLISMSSIENLAVLNLVDELTIFSTLKPSVVFDPIKAKLLLLTLFSLSPLLLYIQNRYISLSEFVPSEMESPRTKAIARIILGIGIVLVVPIMDWTTQMDRLLLSSWPVGFGFLAALITFFFCWYFLCIAKNFFLLNR